MTSDSPRAAKVGPWAKEKLEALEAYLDYYTKRLKNQPQWRTIYLDAFAGGGRAVVRRKARTDNHLLSLWDDTDDASPEEEQFIQGSPRRALAIANPFDSYIFIDADPTRVAMLRDLKEEYRETRKITVREGSADGQIAWVLSKKPAKDKHRGVAFLDPFGAHLEWKSIQALADTQLFEVIINFPLHMCLNRLMTRDPNIRENWKAQLDAFLPPGWYEQVYEDVASLLGEEKQKRSDALERLLGWYKDQLRDAFGYVSEARLIRNTRGGPLYYLLWAGTHPAGLKGADHVMKMGERLPKG